MAVVLPLTVDSVLDASVDVVSAAVDRGFTTTNWDLVSSQVAHNSGFDGRSSNWPTPDSQQTAPWSVSLREMQERIGL